MKDSTGQPSEISSDTVNLLDSRDDTGEIIPKRRRFLGIELNEGIYAWNLIGAFISSFIGLAVIEFMNSIILFVLESSEYYDMDSNQAGEVFGNIIFITQFFIAFGGDISTGFLFEIFGRKLVIFTGIIISSVWAFLVTYAKPIFFMYLIKLGLGVGIIPILASPLIADYWAKESRALSNSISIIAATMGIISITKILPIMSNKFGLRVATFTWGGMFAFFSILILLLIKDPPKSSNDKITQEGS